MQMADDSTTMTLEIFGRYQDRFANRQAERKMGCILKLVADVATEIGHVPTHSQRRQRTQHSTRIEFPGMVGIVQIAVWGKIVMRNHCPLLLSGPDGTFGIGPIVCCCGKRVKGHIPWRK